MKTANSPTRRPRRLDLSQRHALPYAQAVMYADAALTYMHRQRRPHWTPEEFADVYVEFLGRGGERYLSVQQAWRNIVEGRDIDMDHHEELNAYRRNGEIHR